MLLIPAGDFQMGSNEDDIRGAKPAHTVHLDAFYMDKFEVTTSRYDEFLRATEREGKLWDPINLRKRGNRPVALVSWYDAHAYCEYYGKRLPTEAE